MTNSPEMELDLAFAFFAGLEELFGFVPNLFRIQALLPGLIEAEAGIVRAITLNSQALPRNQELFILLAVASAYRDTYCVTACHGMLLHSLGVTERQLSKILGARQADAALVNLALKLATNPYRLSGTDIIAPREQGFHDETILDAFLVTALSNFLCTLSIGLDPTPDFEPRTIPRQNTSVSNGCSYIIGSSGPYLQRAELSPTRFPPIALFFQLPGFIPNIFHAQTLRRDVIAAEAGLVRAVLVPDRFLSYVQKESIFLVGSAANLNTCCVDFHCEMLRTTRLSKEEFQGIAVDHYGTELSRANKTFLSLARKLTEKPSEFRSDGTKSLRCNGSTEEQALEFIVPNAPNRFYNLLQLGLGTTPDVPPKRTLEEQDAHLSIDHESPPGDQPIDPDAALVARVQGGNLEVFEELVARHSRRVYRTLVTIIGNVEEVQDAMQDTFLKAFVHIHHFQSRSRFSTWLTSIASNTALQLLRDQRRLEPLDDTEDESEFHPLHTRAWEANPEQLYSLAERCRLVESGLKQLPSKYRVVLVLRDIEQLSAEEAAMTLGLRIPALKARLFRARRMLRDTLSPHFALSAPTMDS